MIIVWGNSNKDGDNDDNVGGDDEVWLSDGGSGDNVGGDDKKGDDNS